MSQAERAMSSRTDWCWARLRPKVLRSVTLPGAADGLAFYLKPDFSKVTGKTFLAALGQAFFSLSLGMGAMITYGSYLSKKDNVVTSGIFVSFFDTLIAVMAGLLIFPALFFANEHPDAGPVEVALKPPRKKQNSRTD